MHEYIWHGVGLASIAWGAFQCHDLGGDVWHWVLRRTGRSWLAFLCGCAVASAFSFAWGMACTKWFLE